MCLIIILGSIIINMWDRVLPNKMLQRWASGSGLDMIFKAANFEESRLSVREPHQPVTALLPAVANTDYDIQQPFIC